MGLGDGSWDKVYSDIPLPSDLVQEVELPYHADETISSTRTTNDPSKIVPSPYETRF